MSTANLRIPNQFPSLTKLGQPVEIFQAKTFLIAQIMLSVLSVIVSGGLLIYTAYHGFDLWTKDYYPPIIMKTLLPWLAGFAAGVLT